MAGVAIFALPLAWLAPKVQGLDPDPVAKMVRRVKPTAPQAGLSNSKRRLNVRGAFAVRKSANLKGLRVLLIDDVLTTGATASACASVLKRAGASHVAVAAVARTERRMEIA